MNNDDMYGKALEWMNKGREVALATVVKTWGSSPRPVGSQLVMDQTGAFEGSVSGGCIEGAVITEGLEVLKSGEPRVLNFGVTSAQAWEVGLACGGEISIYLEKVTSKRLLEEMESMRRKNQGVCVITDLENGEKKLLPIDGGEKIYTLFPDFRKIIQEAVKTENNIILISKGHQHFLHFFLPAFEIIIVGAVHIAQPLVQIVRSIGYKVTIIDPRESFANKDRFPDVPIIIQWPDEALPGRLHSRVALVTLTHDPKLDDPALIEGLKSDAFYIGALGSRSTHADRLSRLSAAGFSKDSLERICGPVGLRIGAIGQGEIAISIIAQIIQKRRLAV
ncbi:MAG: XdhC/CoxI family protein [Deltaproteobacteria bacterium HGW-Deltaproteobacteria-12]|jgi:xanthine dehydrogenase accessory factor|nr:MAG: XdhC/CoxI family protein [Deltaproteobacteria bacterium HGW-Deltaproteobacteria-12]